MSETRQKCVAKRRNQASAEARPARRDYIFITEDVWPHVDGFRVDWTGHFRMYAVAQVVLSTNLEFGMVHQPLKIGS